MLFLPFDPYHAFLVLTKVTGEREEEREHAHAHEMMMIAFITFKSSLVPLFEGL